MEKEAIGEKKEVMKVQGENGAWKELGRKKSKWQEGKTKDRMKCGWMIVWEQGKDKQRRRLVGGK